MSESPEVRAVVDAAREWRANRQSATYDLAETSRCAHALLTALALLDRIEAP